MFFDQKFARNTLKTTKNSFLINFLDCFAIPEGFYTRNSPGMLCENHLKFISEQFPRFVLDFPLVKN